MRLPAAILLGFTFRCGQCAVGVCFCALVGPFSVHDDMFPRKTRHAPPFEPAIEFTQLPAAGECSGYTTARYPQGELKGARPVATGIVLVCHRAGRMSGGFNLCPVRPIH
jgi:hypothetical protein